MKQRSTTFVALGSLAFDAKPKNDDVLYAFAFQLLKASLESKAKAERTGRKGAVRLFISKRLYARKLSRGACTDRAFDRLL